MGRVTMSKSIVDLINDLEPALVGYEHLAVSSERDLAEVLRDRAPVITDLLTRYDRLAKRYDAASEALEKVEELTLPDYRRYDEKVADLNEESTALLVALVAELRKED